MSNLVTPEISFIIKELGYNKPCFNYFKSDELVSDDEMTYKIREGNGFYYNYNGYSINEPLYDWDGKKHITTSNPTWEDVKNWILEVYDIYIDIRRNPDKKYYVFVDDYIWEKEGVIKKYDDYNVSRNDAYFKAFEIIKNRQI